MTILAVLVGFAIGYYYKKDNQISYLETRSRIKKALLDEEVVDMEDIGDYMLDRITDDVYYG